MTDERDKQDYIDKKYHYASARGRGKEFAETVYKLILKDEYSLPTHPQYLALGAGFATPEIEFVKQLKLEPSNVYLLDLLYKSRVPDGILSQLEAVNIIPEGIFEFLEHSAQKYSFISAFGLEVTIADNIDTLVPLFAKNLENAGIVYIYPYSGRDANDLWLKHGFEAILPYPILHQGNFRPICYMYKGNSNVIEPKV